MKTSARLCRKGKKKPDMNKAEMTLFKKTMEGKDLSIHISSNLNRAINIPKTKTTLGRIKKMPSPYIFYL